VSSPLSKLPSPARKSLAAAFEAERLKPPYTSLALRRYVGAALAGDVATELGRLAAMEMEPRHLAVTLGLLAGEVKSAPRIDLVWTGPEEGGTDRTLSQMLRAQFDGLVTAERLVRVPGL
jgi:hypothetical protein